MKNIFTASVVLLISLCCVLPVGAQEEAVAQHAIGDKPFFPDENPAKIYAHSFYEYSWIKQGNREGNWRVINNRVAWLNGNMHQPYLDFIINERFKEKDYSIDVGSYFKTDKGYVHIAAGIGDDVDYLYNYKAFGEIEHLMRGNTYTNCSLKYMDYDAGDVGIFSPGIIHYFSDHFILLKYGLIATEGRGRAHFGTADLNLGITEKVRLRLGVSYGQRLFDIYEIPATKQLGYIIFAGMDFKVYKEVVLRVGGSYSEEDPSFRKRSVDVGLSFKF